MSYRTRFEWLSSALPARYIRGRRIPDPSAVRRRLRVEQLEERFLLTADALFMLAPDVVGQSPIRFDAAHGLLSPSDDDHISSLATGDASTQLAPEFGNQGGGSVASWQFQGGAPVAGGQ